jgi:hypothetical protein
MVLFFDKAIRLFEKLRKFSNSIKDDELESKNTSNSIRLDRVENMLKLLPSNVLAWRGESNSFGRFLKTEYDIGVRFFNMVKTQLSDYADFLNGLKKATNDIKYLSEALDNGDIPKEWCYPRCVEKNPMQYISSLSKKLEQLNAIIEQGNFIHPTVSLGRCFDPRSFLMASQQMAASEQQCSLEELHLDFSFDDCKDGYPICDLHFFGAKLDQGKLVLLDDIDFVSLPTGFVRWTTAPVEKATAIPVYANSLRAEVLFHYYLDDPRKGLITTRGIAIVSK